MMPPPVIDEHHTLYWSTLHMSPPPAIDECHTILEYTLDDATSCY